MSEKSTPANFPLINKTYAHRNAINPLNMSEIGKAGKPNRRGKLSHYVTDQFVERFGKSTH